MKSYEIRKSFLDFFRDRGHVIEKSDSLIPKNDPTLLFTSAGMVQFKPYYTGEVPVPYRRASTVQKCLRAGGKANDLEEVGKTSRHLTFFEMLGNFSFGDYFKREAIHWAWEYSTQIMKIKPEQIWVSVYVEDDEAFNIWNKEIGVPEKRIVRMGAKDNFWGPAGDSGACGPCSELLFDKGEEVDPNATPENDPHERFLEFWNLVFPQYDQQPDGTRLPLKNRGIDTGMGLERMCLLLQNKPTVFDTDVLFPIIEATQQIADSTYKGNPVPFRVIADHIRALSFMTADGILPANEGRGYVWRRILRRAARFGREIGLTKPFLFQISKVVVENMGKYYPELIETQTQIEKIIHLEEERFGSTLARGMDLLRELFEDMNSKGEKQIAGDILFKLHDTYGFPLDIVKDMAEEQGFELDEKGYIDAKEKQRELTRKTWVGSGQQEISPIYHQILTQYGETEFIGYQQHTNVSTIVAIIKENKIVDEIQEGEEAYIILNKTPFYAESGGQVGDTGSLTGLDGKTLIDITDTKKVLDKLFVHYGKVINGNLKVGQEVNAIINIKRRLTIQNHHTATHLLQASLRDILGEHVHQCGSLVSEERLRFDFTHFEAVGYERLLDIEKWVNEKIQADYDVEILYLPIEEAKKLGAMALFGEKYGDIVRVVKINEISTEFCGGCHVPKTGVIGGFKIISESSVSAGVRRIEAICGEPFIQWIQKTERTIKELAESLNTTPELLYDRVFQIIDENKKITKELEKWKRQALLGEGRDILKNLRTIDGINYITLQMENEDIDQARSLVDHLKDKIKSGIVVIGIKYEDKATFCVGVTKDLTNRFSSSEIVNQLAQIVGGKGGGRKDFAQAGGKNIEKFNEAIENVPKIISIYAKQNKS
ncbi:MAG TPA: alanine--tRNA ligase [Candidatus Hydrogenedens sp.]|nr:alanine--tRNA ligase [Candidatus Hydrogenedens sp.]HPP58323.1 alanine--tRNA ligase [Candidatus Hydrogenedens sp.]